MEKKGINSLSSQEQSNLSTAHIILYNLRDDMNIMFPLLKVGKSLVYVGSASFDYHCSEAA